MVGDQQLQWDMAITDKDFGTYYDMDLEAEEQGNLSTNMSMVHMSLYGPYETKCVGYHQML